MLKQKWNKRKKHLYCIDIIVRKGNKKINVIWPLVGGDLLSKLLVLNVQCEILLTEEEAVQLY